MPKSEYYGFDMRYIRDELNRYEATSYLYHLVIINSIKKSGLCLISEDSGESQSNSVKSGWSQIIQAVSHEDLSLESNDGSNESGCKVNLE